MSGYGRYATRTCDTPNEDDDHNIDTNGYLDRNPFRSRHALAMTERPLAQTPKITSSQINAITTFAIQASLITFIEGYSFSRTLLAAYRATLSHTHRPIDDTAIHIRFQQTALPIEDLAAALFNLDAALQTTPLEVEPAGSHEPAELEKLSEFLARRTRARELVAQMATAVRRVL